MPTMHSLERGHVAHVHRWELVMHMDGCHWYTFAYRCDCGATMNSNDERDPEADPWSHVWFDAEGACVRCRELAEGTGPAPLHSYVVVSRDGTVERET